MRKGKLSFYEFFAGGGMARAGLGDNWRCTFANDFSIVKEAAYISNWGHTHFVGGDIREITPAQLDHTADLAWASFPCQDLSLAGDYKGLGRAPDKAKTRSGTFWIFIDKIRALASVGRAPRTIVLENVVGTLTSRRGSDFAAIADALTREGYYFGAMQIDAKLFVPQSRPRLFIFCVRRDMRVDARYIAPTPHKLWHPHSLVVAHGGISKGAKENWIWWNLPVPPPRTTKFENVLETDPVGVEWHTSRQTQHILSLMTQLNLAKVAAAKKAGRRVVGTLYRRTRPDENGVRKQRAEVRFDDTAGCLRTPAGGSSRQSVLIVEGKSVRSRLMSPRETARLMGLPDTYRLPNKYNDAYFVCGDGVVVPVVRHLGANLVEKILAANSIGAQPAAE